MSPDRDNRSHCGDVADTVPGLPASEWVKLSCICTPCDAVATTEAYWDPDVVLSLTMIPALAHGWMLAAAVSTAPLSPDVGLAELTSEVTRTVMLPLPLSGWCMK